MTARPIPARATGPVHPPGAPADRARPRAAARGQHAEDPRLEAEARRAADRVLARRPAGPLGARDPAALPGPAGPGHALPAGLRARLEAGFGADLSGLRVHTDPAAAALAAKAGAQAFAAGAHLVFAAHAFRPQQPQGLRLIAHETAHALQQGLAPRPGGPVAVQRQQRPPDDPSDPIPGGPLFAEIEEAHLTLASHAGRAPDPEAPGFMADRAALRAALAGGTLTVDAPNDTSRQLAQAVAAHRFRSFRGRCLAFDLLAWSGEHAAALVFLGAHLDLESAAQNRAFEAHYMDSADYLRLAGRLLDTDASGYVQGQWEGFAHRIAGWLSDPRTPLPRTSALHALFEGLQATGDGPSRLQPNIAQLHLLAELHQIETHLLALMHDPGRRTRLLEQLFLEGHPRAMPGIEHLGRVAVLNDVLNGRLAALGGRTSTGARVDPDWRGGPVIERLADRLGGTARRAMAAGIEAVGIVTAIARRSDTAVPANANMTPPGITSSPPLRALLAALYGAVDPDRTGSVLYLAPASATGTQGLDPDTPESIRIHLAFLGRLPDPAAFDTARATLVTTLHTARDSLAGAMATAPPDRRPAAGADTADAGAARTLDRHTTLLLGLLWSDWLAAWISDAPAPASPDQVARIRYRIANALGTGARVLEGRALAQRVAHVHDAVDTGYSYAVIPAEFEHRPGADYADLAREIEDIHAVFNADSATPDVRSLAISSVDLVHFFQEAQLSAQIVTLHEARERIDRIAEWRLARTPQQELADTAAETATDTVPEMPDLDRLLQEARDSVHHPRLYEVPGGHLVMNPADALSSPFTVQLRHPSMPARFGDPGAPTTHAPIFEGLTVLRGNVRTNEVYFWTLPPLDGVWNAIDGIEALQPLLAEFKAEASIPADASGLVWLVNLTSWARDQSRIPEMREILSDHFEDELDDARIRLREAERLLSIVNRKLALNELRNHLSLLERDVGRFLLPDRFARILAEFGALVRPAEDRDQQIVALLLDAVEEFERAVSAAGTANDPTHAAIAHLLPPVQLAISFLRGVNVAGVLHDEALPDLGDGGATLRDRLAALEPFQLRGGEPEARYGRLDALWRTLLAARSRSQQMWTLFGDPREGLHSAMTHRRIRPQEDAAAFVLALAPGRDALDPAEGDWRWDPEAHPPTSDGSAEPAPGLDRTIGNTREPVFYRIDAIHAGFEFRPPFSSGAAGADTAVALHPDTGRRLPDATALVTLSVANLLRDGEDGHTMAPLRTVVIHARDRQLLTLLAAVIDTHARHVQMQELTAALDAGGALVLDALEFVPGYGQALMIARLVINITDMISSGELDALREHLVDGPLEMIDLIAQLLGQLDGTVLWKFLLMELFGGGAERTVLASLQRMVMASNARRRRQVPHAAAQRARRLPELAGALSGIGLTFAEALLSAERRAGVAVNATAGRLASKPRVAPHLARVGQYARYAELATAMLRAAEGAVGTHRQELRRDLAGLQAGFDPAALRVDLTGLLTDAGQIDLPTEVVPTAMLVEVALEYLVGALRNRKVRFLYQALRMSGQLPRLADAVERRLLSGTAADPNRLWQSQVHGRLQAQFADGRNGLVRALVETLEAVFPDHPMAAPDLPPAVLGHAELHVPDAPEAPQAGLPPTPPPGPDDGTHDDLAAEIERRLGPDADAPGAPGTTPAATTGPAPAPAGPQTDGFNLPGDPRHPHPGRLPDRAGRPLPDDLRARLEAGFGHDLGHVRLHDDAAAAAHVDATGAEALASGSNVYLGGAVRPDTPHGDHVLRHEVAHVLQQTGPRPQSDDSAHSRPAHPQPDRPVPGRPGRGVQRDPAREAAAEAMARASRHRHRGDGPPLAVRGGGGEGLAPFARRDAIKLLQKLGEKAGTGGYVEALLAGHDPLQARHARTALDEAERLRTDLHAAIARATWAGATPRRLHDPETNWLALLRHEASLALQRAGLRGDAERLVARAVVTRPRHRRTPGNHYQLRARAYVNILAGYIHEAAGVRLDIALASGSGRIRSVTLRGLHLGRVRAVGDTRLYSALRRANPDGDPPGFEFRLARSHYRTRFPRHQSWQHNATRFEIPAAEKRLIVELSSRPAQLAPDLLPPWREYVDPDRAPLGLRVGLHRTLTPRSSSFNNTDRESHHLPQFLFAEFYSGISENDTNEVSIWGRDGAFWTPGFVPMGGGGAETSRPSAPTRYRAFNAAGGQFDMAALSLTTNRGADMPAVSLAVPTHRKGRLHLPAETAPDGNADTDTHSNATQGFMMSAMHRQFLVREVGAVRSRLGVNTPEGVGDLANPATFRNLVDVAVASDSRRRLLEQATWNAMRASYGWMVDHMWDRLSEGLGSLETSYYEGIALQRQSADAKALTDGDPHTPSSDTTWIADIRTALQAANARQFGALAQGVW